MANITYPRQGDYLIPDLIPPEAPKNIGVWGERRRRYLRDHRDGLYTGMLITGKLNAHLAEIDKQATEMCEELMRRFAKLEGVTEKLKAEDQMKWVQAMNSIRNRAEEIVNAKIVFV